MISKKNIKNLISVIVGSFIFCLGISLFVTPVNIYNGGTLGIAEIIRTLLERIGIDFHFEISGILNFMLNIPLLFIAKKVVSKKFFMFTLVGILSQTFFFTILPTFKPIISDRLTSVVVGGIIAGFGVGTALKSHGSSGGVDILGVCFSKKFSNFSVGKMGMIVNTIIFVVCGILFNVQTAIYSILYMMFYTHIVDKIHYQNIETTVTIFTKNKQAMEFITKEIHRGVTYWEGYGGYTGDKTYIMMTALAKDEMQLFKNEIKKIDPKAFIIMSDNLSICGNFEKRL